MPLTAPQSSGRVPWRLSAGRAVCVALPLLLFTAPIPAGSPGSAAGSAGQYVGFPPKLERSSPELKAPTVLRNQAEQAGRVEVELRAEPAQQALLPGVSTAVYAYNGSVPGPTLELLEGDEVVVRFRNDLPEATTVHWHGLHIPFDVDGSPFHPVAPGDTYEYRFTVPYGSAGTYWYHPHPHHHTAWQVGMGLHGAIIVRAVDDPLPADLPEQLLVLWDNRFLPDGSLDFPDRATAQGELDALNGREGDVLFVNGSILPWLDVPAGEVQRWRVVNASGARIYRLAIPGHSFVHIGSDGGLFERPIEVDEILLTNGERAELLVKGAKSTDTRAVLQTLPYDRYLSRARPADWNRPRDLVTVRFVDEPARGPHRIPDQLRPVPSLDPAEATATRLMLMSQGRINGRTLDMSRVDVHAALGATEIWQIENLVGMDHPFHLHGFQFQVLDRNGVKEAYPAWKDTVNVPKWETVRFIVRYADHRGKWMFHCHILDHEDQGMMGILEVR
jgi:FtsP/CotA-like multicopper oxidase with cupredoxin domain